MVRPEPYTLLLSGPHVVHVRMLWKGLHRPPPPCLPSPPLRWELGREARRRPVAPRSA